MTAHNLLPDRIRCTKSRTEFPKFFEGDTPGCWLRLQIQRPLPVPD